MYWRLIIDGPASAARHMAVDEAISISVRKKLSPPTLRLYSWNGPAVTIGYFQKIQREVNLEYCRQNHIDVVRRMTGGRAVVHGREELTYNFSAPFLTPFSGLNLHETYRLISNAFITGLRRIGIDAAMSSARRTGTGIGKNPVCFQSLSFAEATVDGRKIIGSAQKRWPDGLMQQGSIPLVLNHDLLYSTLSFGSDAAKKRAMAAADMKMVGLRDLVSGLSISDLVVAIRHGFEITFGISFSEEEGLSPVEQQDASVLEIERYEAEAWNWKR